MSYKEKDGSLILDEQDFKSAKAIFPSLSPDLKGLRLARIEALSKDSLAERAETPVPPAPPKPQKVPCQAKWSNALRMELVDMEGKCLHFTAASRGPFYVLFSAVPRNEEKRYVVEISPSKVTIFKVGLATDHFNLNTFNCLMSIRICPGRIFYRHCYLHFYVKFFLVIISYLNWNATKRTKAISAIFRYLSYSQKLLTLSSFSLRIAGGSLRFVSIGHQD